MKIEIDDNTFYSTVWIVVAAIIISTVEIVSSNYTERAKSAFENGLEEGSISGYSGAVWIKK